jgi:hypothetical protein
MNGKIKSILDCGSDDSLKCFFFYKYIEIIFDTSTSKRSKTIKKLFEVKTISKFEGNCVPKHALRTVLYWSSCCFLKYFFT